MKKAIKIFLKLILGLVIIALVLSGVSLYFLYDGKNVASDQYKNYETTLNKEVNDLAVKSLRNTKNNSMISVSMDEERINNLLVGVTKSLNEVLNKSGASIDNIELSLQENNKIKVYGYGKYLFMKASLTGDLQIIETDEDIFFQILNAKISKLNANNETIGETANFFIKDEKIEKDLADIGIDVDVKVSELSIRMTKEALLSLIKTYLPENSSSSFYTTLVDISLKNKLVSFNFNDDQNLGVYVDTSKLSYNTTDFDEVPEYINYDYESIKAMMKTLIDNNVANYENESDIYSYLIGGYKRIKENEKLDYLADIDFSSIGINDYTKYEGIITSSKTTLLEIISEVFTPSNIASILLTKGVTIDLSETALNNILLSSGLMSTAFMFYSNDGGFEISTAYIEGFYTKISDGKMNMDLVFNLNGKRCAVKLVIVAKETTGLSLSGKVDSMNLGNIQLKEEEISSVLNYLDSLTSEIDWMSMDGTKNTVTLSFNSYFSKFENVLNSFNSTTSFVDGNVRVSFSK